jgi:hypothetical protein
LKAETAAGGGPAKARSGLAASSNRTNRTGSPRSAEIMKILRNSEYRRCIIIETLHWRGFEGNA